MMKQIPVLRADILVWIMALFAIVGCSDGIDITETSELGTTGNAPKIVNDAQRLIKQEGEFYLLNMNLRNTGKTGKKCKEGAISSKHLRVRWDKYHLFKDRSQEVVAFPVEGYKLTALSVLNNEGRLKKTKNKVTAKLIVRRNEDNTFVAIIGTYIYDQNYARDHQAELDTIGYEFENSHFTGYFIASRLNGQMIMGRCIKKGQEDFAFQLNSEPDKLEEEQPMHLYLGINTQNHMTRSAFTEQESSATENCSFCGKSVEECRCVTIVYCRTCKQQKKNGKCRCNTERCSKCNYLLKECNCCKNCKEPRPYCTCGTKQLQPKEDENKHGPNPNPGNGGTGGGNTGGWNMGGGFGYGGGNYSGQTLPNPHGLNKLYTITSSKMISTSKQVVASMINQYGSQQAVCNIGVQTAFKSLFPGQSPPGMTGRANDMTKAWAQHPEKWKRISLEEAQKYANAGLFVVAGWINPTGRSGHVVVILPGEAKPSKRFNKDMPRTMDTGENKRKYQNHYLDNSFGPSKLPHVVFYYYKN